MKLNEITATGHTPLLIILMQQLLKKGERIAWSHERGARFAKSDESTAPWWIQKIERKDHPVTNTSPKWLFTYDHGIAIRGVTYSGDNFDNEFELIPGKTKGTWEFRSRVD